jgi:predicted phage terminase large subunit-like protein
MFMRSWFKMVPNAPGDIVQRVRFWDLAGTATDAADWTVGTLAGVDASGRVYLLDQRAVQAAPGDVEQLVRWTAEADGVGVPIFMQEDPGQAGKGQTDHYTRNVLMGYAFSPVPIPRVKGAKEKNAAPLSSYAQSGNVYLLEGDWNEDFLEQIEAFPNSKHDDRVESAAGAFQCLSKEQEITIKHMAARPDEFDDRDEYEMEKELAGLQFQ